MKRQQSSLAVERLDDRLVPATWSVPWDNPESLSYSFAPDGTDIGGVKNVLAQDMRSDGYSTTSAWQSEMTRALATWSAAANIKFRPMWDTASPFGANGAVQGDLRFGDIRFGSRPLSDDVVALGTPFTWTGSTWSGDIVLNSKKVFSSNGAPGTYDLYSVVLHEVGHTLGLEGNQIPGSVMEERYSTRTGLSPVDVAAVQELYGPPQATTTTKSWFDIMRMIQASREFYQNITGTLEKANQRNVTTVTSPAANGTEPLNLLVYARALSFNLGLTPQIAVYDSNGRSVPFEVISNSQGWVSIQVRNVTPSSQYRLETFNSLLGTTALKYSIGVEFNQDPPVERDVIASNELSRTKPTDTGTLVLKGSRLVSFSLTSSWNGDTAVRMTITDSTGKVAAQLVSSSGFLPPTAEVFLEAGTYSITYTAFRPGGQSPRRVNFVAMISIMNDPIGTYMPPEEECTLVPNDSNMRIAVEDPTTTPDYAYPDYSYFGYIDPLLTTMYLYYY